MEADFSVQTNNLQADMEIAEAPQFDCQFSVFASGTIWGSISGLLSDQTDLYEALTSLSDRITLNSEAIETKQDILTAGSNIQIVDGVISATDTTYTAGSGISIENGVISNTHPLLEWGNITGTLSNQSDLQLALNNKQDTISDLSTIRSNASKGLSAYNTISGYGNIVTYDASDFATSQQGALADTSLQPNDNISELVNDVGYITGISGSDVTDALGFTPYDATNPNGFISGITSGDVTTALGYTPYDNSNPNGFISGITSTDVTTALGYTPYNSTNPAGYITSASLSNYVTTNTAQTISVSKAFSQPLVIADNNGIASGTILSNKKILQRSSGDNTVTLNNKDNKLRLVGSEARPQYSADGNTFSSLALYSDIPSDYVPETREINGHALSSDITLTYSDVNALASSTTINDLTTQAQQDALNSGATSSNIGQITTNANDISDIKDVIPSSATSSNKLTDKNYVDSSISTNTAYFDGSWATYSDVPSTVAGFTSEGLPEPSNNNYLIVLEDETQDGGTWRYKYVDNGGAYDKANWNVEYEVNETPFTQSQLDAINSGITSADVTLIGTALQPGSNISELNNDAGYITSASLPTVNNGVLTIQKNSTTIDTFSANSSSNVTVNISVPTDTLDITNGAGYITSSALSGYVLSSQLSAVATSGQYSDLTGTPTIPTATSDLVNDSGFITSSALSGYATETWVGNQGYITGITSSDVTTALGYTPYNSSNPAGYITSSALTNYVTNTDLSTTLASYVLSSSLSTVATSGSYNDLSNKPTIPTVPTNISAFNNDSGYITSSALSGYATETWVTNQGYTTNVGTVTSVNNISPDNNGNVTLTIPIVDQTYDGTSANAQSGVAIEGELANYVNTNLSNLSATGKTVIDGQWVSSYLQIDSTTSIHTTKHNLGTTGTGALSYLPADCTTYDYEVFVAIYGATTSSGVSHGYAYNNSTATDGQYGRISCNANARHGNNSFVLPIYNGEMWTSVATTAFSSSFNVILLGYRRLGTNT